MKGALVFVLVVVYERNKKETIGGWSKTNGVSKSASTCGMNQ